MTFTPTLQVPLHLSEVEKILTLLKIRLQDVIIDKMLFLLYKAKNKMTQEM